MPPPDQNALFEHDRVATRREVVPRAVVHKTFSGLLFDVLAGVYADLGFDALRALPLKRGGRQTA